MTLSSNQSDQRQKRTGEIFYDVAMQKGPLFIKGCQIAACDQRVREDIRKDLRKARHQADKRPRLEYMNWVKHYTDELEQRYNSHLEKPATSAVFLEHIGIPRGWGSLYVAIPVRMSDQKSFMLAFERPHNLSRSEEGYEVVMNYLPPKHERDENDNFLAEVAEHSFKRISLETNSPIAKLQGEALGEIYGNSYARSLSGTFEFDTVEVILAGSNFYLMEVVDGDVLEDVLAEKLYSKEERDNLCMHLGADILDKLFQLNFEGDRHPGNIIVSKTNRNKLTHIDVKALPLAPPDELGIRQVSDLLTDTLSNITFGGDLSQLLSFEPLVRSREALRASGVDIAPIVTDVQLSLFKWAELVEDLTPQQLTIVVLSALRTGRMHPALQSSLYENLERSLPNHMNSLVGEVRTFIQDGKIGNTLKLLLGDSISEHNLISLENR